ncbi:putative alkylated DNA repair protein AlkB [Helianthus annuus]|nr:putative alkylated DNA repair protein AlkB [Helianthus annuus]
MRGLDLKVEKTQFYLAFVWFVLKDLIVDIVNICEKWGGSRGCFYEESDFIEGEEDYYRIHTCFGRIWDPETKYADRCKRDGFEPPPIPYQLYSLAEFALEDAKAHLHKLRSMSPETCIVRFYPSLYGRRGLHRDPREAPCLDFLRLLPTVSIFIGDTAEVDYYCRRRDVDYNTVMLRSGDVLINGGIFRYFSHGVKQIHEHTMPQSLLQDTALKSGCLNLSLRQY